MPFFPPYSEESLQYYLWGWRKGFLRPNHWVPDIEIPEEQTGPYYGGIRDGEGHGAHGYPVDRVCYDLTEPHSLPGTVAEAVDLIYEGGSVPYTWATRGLLTAGLEGGLMWRIASLAA